MEDMTMSINGAKFLDVTRAEGFTVSPHARHRMEQFTGIDVTESVAFSLFKRGKQLRIDELRLRGYRPAYEPRRRKGIESWYFCFQLFGQELVAVIGCGSRPNEYVWLTTLGPTVQQDRLRITQAPSAAVAAA
jgi:hypothetical protein